MKAMNKLSLAGTMAVLAVAPVAAQNIQAVQNNDHRAPVVTTSNGYVSQPGDNFLTKANKASGLIGMDVRNPQNEKLGDIKDLVVDLHSGRIAYAVLSVGGFLGIGDKYLAIPPNQFGLSPDGKELILNADKARLESAPGFTKSNWPALADPAWGNYGSYWQPNRTAVGTVGAVNTGRDTVSTLPPANYATFSGRVLAIDGVSRTVTVEGPSGKQKFHMASVGSNLRSNTMGDLESLRVGDVITVRYFKQHGDYMIEGISHTR